MKKPTYVKGILALLLLILLGMILNFTHWKYGALASGIFLFIGIGGLMLILIQLFSKYYCERSK